MDAKVVPGPGANGRVDAASAASNASRHSIQSVDRALLLLETIADMGGEATGKSPVDRGKSGTKRHVLADQRGAPIVIEVTGANRHDSRAARAMLPSCPDCVIR